MQGLPRRPSYGTRSTPCSGGRVDLFAARAGHAAEVVAGRWRRRTAPARGAWRRTGARHRPQARRAHDPLKSGAVRRGVAPAPPVGSRRSRAWPQRASSSAVRELLIKKSAVRVDLLAIESAARPPALHDQHRQFFTEGAQGAGPAKVPASPPSLDEPRPVARACRGAAAASRGRRRSASLMVDGEDRTSALPPDPRGARGCARRRRRSSCAWHRSARAPIQADAQARSRVGRRPALPRSLSTSGWPAMPRCQRCPSRGSGGSPRRPTCPRARPSPCGARGCALLHHRSAAARARVALASRRPRLPPWAHQGEACAQPRAALGPAQPADLDRLLAVGRADPRARPSGANAMLVASGPITTNASCRRCPGRLRSSSSSCASASITAPSASHLRARHAAAPEADGRRLLLASAVVAGQLGVAEARELRGGALSERPLEQCRRAPGAWPCVLPRWSTSCSGEAALLRPNTGQNARKEQAPIHRSGWCPRRRLVTGYPLRFRRSLLRASRTLDAVPRAAGLRGRRAAGGDGEHTRDYTRGVLARLPVFLRRRVHRVSGHFCARGDRPRRRPSRAEPPLHQQFQLPGACAEEPAGPRAGHHRRVRGRCELPGVKPPAWSPPDCGCGLHVHPRSQRRER